MAKNTDNEAGVNMNDFSDNLPPAIANEKAILETAHILKSLCTFDAEVPIKEYFSGLKKVYQTLDMALEWLERSTRNANAEMENHDKTQPRPLGDKTDGENKDNVGGKQPNTDAYQKMEGILSGLYHITECGSHAYLVGLVKLSSEMLDLPYNLFSAKRKHIKECIKEVEKETKKVSALVDTACDILQEIIKDDQFNSRKADVLNTKIRQAKLIIETCKKFLSNAKESIDELMPVMSVMKYLSRLSRIAGFGVTVYWLYYNISTFDSLATYIPGLNLIWEYLSQKPIPFVAACTASGYAWLSLFPSRAYAFRDGLKDLKLEHQRLTYRLDGLEKRLDAAREDILKKSKQ